MPERAEIERIQAYLRENARHNYESVPLPPFTLFFHRTDPFKYFNYAIPDEDVEVDETLPTILARLRDTFQQRRRVARFEFFEAFAPRLPAALQASGFVEEGRQWSMLCTPETLQPPPEVPGLQITRLQPDSPAQDLLDFVLAQRQGFDPTDTSTPGPEDLAQMRQGFLNGGWAAFLGRIQGQPAGVSQYAWPIDGITEVAGVATRELFRGRGIASLLTWLATRSAFERGVQIACLTAADARAGRVYERIGFYPFSTMLAYIDGAAHD